MKTLLLAAVVTSPFWFYPLTCWMDDVLRHGTKHRWERWLAIGTQVGITVGLGGTILWITLWVTLT